MLLTVLRLIAVALVTTALAWSNTAQQFEPTRISTQRDSAQYASALDEARRRHFGGHVVHIDPATGERLQTPPTDLRISPPVSLARNALSQRSMPGGGVQVRLGGNFHAFSHAHIDEHGRTNTACKASD